MKRQTVVETPSYLARATKFLAERERDKIVSKLAEDPECGDVMAGTGGFRKIACAACGDGQEWRRACRVYLAERSIPGFSD